MSDCLPPFRLVLRLVLLMPLSATALGQFPRPLI